jgi:phosphinothricin acetyltransferase
MRQEEATQDGQRDPGSSIAVPCVRTATIKDLPRIVEIYNQAVADKASTCDLSGFRVEQRVDWFNHHTYPYGIWVISKGDSAVCGWAILFPFNEKECFLPTVMSATYIERSQQGQGLGKYLRGFVVEQASKRGFHSIIARIWATNERSIRLSEDLGFTEVGRFKEVVRRDEELLDVVYYQKILQ